MEETGKGIDEWDTVESAPMHIWVKTRKEGEEGENTCFAHQLTDGEIEWVALDGRTTITHHSFAAPTHWRKLEPDET